MATEEKARRVRPEPLAVKSGSFDRAPVPARNGHTASASRTKCTIDWPLEARTRSATPDVALAQVENRSVGFRRVSLQDVTPLRASGGNRARRRAARVVSRCRRRPRALSGTSKPHRLRWQHHHRTTGNEVRRGNVNGAAGLCLWRNNIERCTPHPS